MINRRQAIKTTVAATATLALPIVSMAKDPEPIWELHTEKYPHGFFDLPDEVVCFTIKWKHGQSQLFCDLNDCKINTIEQNQIELFIAWHETPSKVRLSLNDYNRLKDYVYQHNVKDRLGCYNYKGWGFNWIGKYKLWRNGKINYEELNK